MSDLVVALTLVTALGCGLNAGVFFAFSGFVMNGLRRLPAAQGIAAMQSINVTASPLRSCRCCSGRRSDAWPQS